MADLNTLKSDLATGAFRDQIAKLYIDPARVDCETNRYMSMLDKFTEFFTETDVHIFSAPGRSEIGGNHTDHQHGEVLAASINDDAVAVAAAIDAPEIQLLSEGYPMLSFSIDNVEKIDAEEGTTNALIRGVVDGLKKNGHKVGGFHAYVTSEVLSGSGLSSSAAFETLIGTIESGLYNNMEIDAVEIAKIGQYAENYHFGKPCGLLDQMACSVGSLVHIDFADPTNPVVEQVVFDFEGAGYSLCITDTKGSHANLTDDYAAIPAECKSVAAYFGKDFLNDVPEEDFMQAIPTLRAEGICNDRAIIRAIHFYGETKRAAGEAEALKSGDIQKFFELFKKSGDSSYKYLQNVYTNHDVEHQNVSVGLAVSDTVLGANGIARVHGGGFAGTIQAFVKNEAVADYQAAMNHVFGEGACAVLKIREFGGYQLV